MQLPRHLQNAATRLGEWVSHLPPAVVGRSEVPTSGVKQRLRGARGLVNGALVGQGRYQVEEQVGSGSMGWVYSAWHTQLHRAVALKVLRPEFLSESDIVERFLNEARLASSIESEHVVRVFDCGTLEDGTPFFAMELLEGGPLSEILASNHSLPMAVAVEIAMQVASGLAAAHAKNVIHRDLKPENVMLVPHGEQQWRAKIVDFGIAKALDSDEEFTCFGNVFGTPQYMSPEQTLGAAIDHRSDIYALGVLMYEMLSGKLPVAGKYVGEILAGQRGAPLRPLRSQAPARSIPPRLEAIVHRCLEKDPDRRYQAVQAVVRDLKQFLERERASKEEESEEKAIQTFLSIPSLTPSARVAPREVLRPGSFPVRREMPTYSGKKTGLTASARLLLGCIAGAILGLVASLLLGH